PGQLAKITPRPPPQVLPRVDREKAQVFGGFRRWGGRLLDAPSGARIAILPRCRVIAPWHRRPLGYADFFLLPALAGLPVVVRFPAADAPQRPVERDQEPAHQLVVGRLFRELEEALHQRLVTVGVERQGEVVE